MINIKKAITSTAVAGAMFASLVMPAFAAKPATVPGPWDVSGSYVVNVEYLGTDYPEDLVLTQSGTSITGTSLELVGGGSPWTIDSGSVSENDIDFSGYFNSNPSMRVNFLGTINPDGSMSGTWADEAPGTRTGTWESTSGNAIRFEGNHGQYVSSQENKQEAAHSRIGMPEQSKGHTN